MPALVCLVALLLLLVAHGINLGIGAAVAPAFGRQDEKLFQHNLNGFTLALGRSQHQSAHGPQFNRKGFFGRVVGVQQAPVCGILFPAQVPCGTEVVANVKWVVVHDSPKKSPSRNSHLSVLADW